MRPPCGKVLTFWTGTEVTAVAFSVTSRSMPLTTSRTVKRVDIPGAAGKSPALMMSMPLSVLSFTKSVSLTLSTWSPRRRPTPGADAGEPGST
ncbi:hypothetical protein D3C86_1752260 [compost metagenome]